MAGTPIGRILLMPKGDYSSSAIYDHLDVVRHAGASWVCTQDSTTGIAPAAGVAEWQLMVADGSVGGWASLANKPFETIGSGLDVNASDELFVDIGNTLKLDAITNKIEVEISNLYIPSSTGSDLPISGQGVADAIDQTYSALSTKAQSGVAVASGIDSKLHWVTGSVSNANSVTIPTGGDAKIVSTSKIACLLADDGTTSPVKYSTVSVDGTNHTITVTFPDATTADIAVGISNS